MPMPKFVIKVESSGSARVVSKVTGVPGKLNQVKVNAPLRAKAYTRLVDNVLLLRIRIGCTEAVYKVTFFRLSEPRLLRA